MFLLGHEGITLGAAAIAAGVFSNKGERDGLKRSWFTALTRNLDVRLLLIGALLPDIIDKPLGIYILKLDNGRIYAHTLLFLLIISAAGYYLYKRRSQVWLLTLAAGTLAHLITDEMWQIPGTLFWPLLGPDFPRQDLGDYIINELKEILTNPYILTTEIIGVIILIWFGVWLITRHKLGVFIRQGKI